VKADDDIRHRHGRARRDGLAWSCPGRLQRLRPLLGVALALLIGLAPRVAGADAPKPPPPRPVAFQWDGAKQNLYVNLAFRDAVDAEIQGKLGRGLPTTIVFTGAIYRPGAEQPLSTTAQTCRITWHVWDEVYLIEVVRPGSTRLERSLNLNGVLRRCAEVGGATPARWLLAGTSAQIPLGVPVFLRGKVQVNPISPDVLQKIRRWVSRPSGTGLAAPGDALFSTFTGLFLQRVGVAERELDILTAVQTPSVAPEPAAR